jgi:hypothetical protein
VLTGCTTSFSGMASKFNIVVISLIFLTTSAISHATLGTFVIDFHTKFHIPSCYNLLVIALKLKAKENIRTRGILLITFYKNIDLTKVL